MTELISEKRALQELSKENLLFSAHSVEDVAFFFDSFDEDQKKSSCLCFAIRADGLLDTEAIIEASRWLCSHTAIFVPSLPLEPSALFLVDEMRPRAISLHPLYTSLGDVEIKFGLLEAILLKLSTPIWMAQNGLSAEQLVKLQALPIEKFWHGVF